MPRKPRYDRDVALEKAVVLFWERGYYAASLKHLELALDMRPGSLYATFGSKEGLFLEALNLYSDRMKANLDACLEGAPSKLDGIRRYLRYLAGGCASAGPDGDMPVPACMVVKTLLEVNTQDEALRHRANQLLAVVEERLYRELLAAQEAGELRPDVDCARLARLLQAQIMGLRSFAQRSVDAAQVAALADDMVDLIDAYAVAPAHP